MLHELEVWRNSLRPLVIRGSCLQRSKHGAVSSEYVSQGRLNDQSAFGFQDLLNFLVGYLQIPDIERSMR